MPKFFIKTSQINGNEINILNEDVNHIANVLRERIGNEINICNVDTSENFLCKIREISTNHIKCDILKKLKSEAESNIEITIFQGLPKAEKMELIIQKCTELGVKEIFPVKMERSIVKLDKKSGEKKIERWQKIAEVASKQSGRDNIPKINNIININNVCNLISMYDILLIAYEKEDGNSLKAEIAEVKKLKKENLKIGVVIGPEGGLEEWEVDQLTNVNAKSISLGKRILRTETAPIVITSILMYELES